MATCATRINILTAVHMDDTLGQSENRSSAIELLLNCSIGSALSRDPMLLLIRAKCRFHLAPNVNEQLHIDTNQVSILNFSLTWRNVITAVTTSPHLLNQTQWIDYSLNTADYDHDTVQVWWLLFFLIGSEERSQGFDLIKRTTSCFKHEISIWWAGRECALRYRA